MSDQHLFVAFVLEKVEDHGSLRIYYTHASDFGPARDQILSAAKADGVHNPVVQSMDPSPGFPEDMPLEDSAKEGVRRCKSVIHIDEFEETPIQWPYGAIPSTDQDVAELEQEGYQLVIEENDVHYVPIFVSESKLETVLAALYTELGTCTHMFIALHDTEESQVTMNKSGSFAPEEVRAFLEESRTDIVRNGDVTFGIYFPEGKSKLFLSNCKFIGFETQSEAMCMKVMDRLEKEGVPAADELISGLQLRMWHFTDPEGRSLDEIMVWLESIGFTA